MTQNPDAAYGPRMPPTDVHGDLKPDRLLFLARLIRATWKSSRRSFRRNKGDTMWGLGTKFHERLRYALQLAAQSTSWLKIIKGKRHFVFSIGALPMRCYRGSRNRPRPNYRPRRGAELNGNLFAFDKESVAELTWVYRIAVEARTEKDLPEVFLVQHGVDSDAVGRAWALDKKSLKAAPIEIDVHALEDVLSLHPPVEQRAPSVTPKKTKRSTADGAG